MNHAITVGGLLLALGILIGVAALAVGLLMVFAGGMSDAPSEGDSTSHSGCIIMIVGLVVLVGSVVGLLR